MLRHYRRFWIVPVMLLLLMLPTLTIFAPHQGPLLGAEMRVAAAAPEFPKNPAAWLALPGKIDAYLKDHFSGRDTMIHAQAIIGHKWLASGNERVLIGREGRLFYRGDDMIRQSAGLMARKEQVIEIADLLATMRDLMAAQGIRFLVASPPNSSTVYSDMLPKWARSNGRATEYDLMLAALKARGVSAVDLRQTERAARRDGTVYFEHDTHWSPRGALAGFNAIAAVSHPEWQFDPAQVLGPPVQQVGGDVARMLGFTNDLTEQTEPLAVPAAPAAADGPRILILGDSFTKTLFKPMIEARGGQVTWVAHGWCGFDWSVIATVHPDEVWWMPTERYLLCVLPGRRPVGMPAQP